MYFILNQPVFSDHLSYVTIFQSSPERSHKTGLTYLKKLTFIGRISINAFKNIRFSTTNIHVVTCIKRSLFSCLVIENFIWIETLLRGHLSYKAIFPLSQWWPVNTGLTVCRKDNWNLFFLIHIILFINRLLWMSPLPVHSPPPKKTFKTKEDF